MTAGATSLRPPARAAQAHSSEAGCERARACRDPLTAPSRPSPSAAAGRPLLMTSRPSDATPRKDPPPQLPAACPSPEQSAKGSERERGEGGVEGGMENESVVWHRKRTSTGSGGLVWGESVTLSGICQGQPWALLPQPRARGGCRFPYPAEAARELRFTASCECHQRV